MIETIIFINSVCQGAFIIQFISKPIFTVHPTENFTNFDLYLVEQIEKGWGLGICWYCFPGVEATLIRKRWKLEKGQGEGKELFGCAQSVDSYTNATSSFRWLRATNWLSPQEVFLSFQLSTLERMGTTALH